MGKGRKRKKKRLVASYEENKNDATIFPGTHGEFVQHCEYSKDKEDKYTLEEIKNFYTKLQSINVKALDYMYFYGGTIPYMIANAETSREFGDVDIFVPIEAMNFVREELAKQPTFEIIFDSKRITEGCNLTSHLPEVDVANRKESNGIELIFTFLRDIDENDQTHLENYFTRNEGPKVYQDFGFKGKLFGVNISIFPVYQYKSDLMAKSFNITNMYNYLLAVRVMNNMNIKDFAKNIQINGNKINILPVEYVLISKESAIDQKYVKRMEKDKDDVAFIEKNKEAIGIDEELMEKLRSNYPDYSIALAYYVYDNFVKKISGERYKELMLLNNGEYLS